MRKVRLKRRIGHLVSYTAVPSAQANDRRIWLASLQPASEYPETWRPNPSPVPGIEPLTCQNRLSPESREAQNGGARSCPLLVPSSASLADNPIQYPATQSSAARTRAASIDLPANHHRSFGQAH